MPLNKETKPNLIMCKRLLTQVIILYTNNFLLYSINYSKQILIIFKQIYLTHKCDPNRYYDFGVKGDKGEMAMKGHTAQISRSGH